VEKKIIIFGGSSGIGFELVKYYLNKKFYVFTTYNKSKRDLLKFKKVYRDKLYFRKVKLENKISIKNFSLEIKRLSKDFDVLILNAIHSFRRKSFDKISLSDFNKSIDFNYLSNVYLLKNLSFLFKNRKFKIIHISSLVSKNGSWGLSNYGPIKAAIDNLFKCLKYEYKGFVTFKSIYLGAVNTKGYRFVNKKRKSKNIISVEKARLKILKKL